MKLQLVLTNPPGGMYHIQEFNGDGFDGNAKAHLEDWLNHQKETGKLPNAKLNDTLTAMNWGPVDENGNFIPETMGSAIIDEIKPKE